jgi:hypothetical protein
MRLYDALLIEILQEDVGERRPRTVKRGVRRKQSAYPVRRRYEKAKKRARPVATVI